MVCRFRMLHEVHQELMPRMEDVHQVEVELDAVGLVSYQALDHAFGKQTVRQLVVCCQDPCDQLVLGIAGNGVACVGVALVVVVVGEDCVVDVEASVVVAVGELVVRFGVVVVVVDSIRVVVVAVGEVLGEEHSGCLVVDMDWPVVLDKEVEFHRMDHVDLVVGPEWALTMVDFGPTIDRP